MNRNAYIDRVLRFYLEAPDTPSKPRRGDRDIAGQLHEQKVPIELIQHALALASLRRRLRPIDAESLEPIRSLAYLQPILQHLRETGVDDAYRQHIADRYEDLKTQARV